MSEIVMVVDTETVSTTKPFCYNTGWVVAAIDKKGNMQTLEEKEYMTKEVWYNTMLFSTAYYADKKPIYRKEIRKHNIKVTRFENIIAEMIESINKYNVSRVYAYNSSFDKKVFEFMTEWFHTPNPLAELPILDIRAYFMDLVKDSNKFKNYCEKHELFTESGNYSTTAEVAYRYFTKEDNFIEAHTALADSKIELVILSKCAKYGSDIFTELTALKSIPRKQIKDITLKYREKNYTFKGFSATWYKKRNTLIIK